MAVEAGAETVSPPTVTSISVSLVARVSNTFTVACVTSCGTITRNLTVIEPAMIDLITISPAPKTPPPPRLADIAIRDDSCLIFHSDWKNHFRLYFAW
jgi:hypothetical protein